jgi:hypothetical protein
MENIIKKIKQDYPVSDQRFAGPVPEASSLPQEIPIDKRRHLL